MVRRRIHVFRKQFALWMKSINVGGYLYNVYTQLYSKITEQLSLLPGSRGGENRFACTCCILYSHA
jgi:hypothetical protein